MTPAARERFRLIANDAALGGERQPRLLMLTRDELMRHEAAGITTAAFSIRRTRATTRRSATR